MANLFDIRLVFTQIPVLLGSLPVTLYLTLLCMLGGLALGLGVAIINIYRIPVLRHICVMYVSITRGTPIIVQLYLTYFGIPLALKYINFYYATSYTINQVPSVVFVLIALSLNQGAYSSETLRAALLSVDKRQVEAAYSLGMTSPQVMRRVIMPQAFVVALPSLGNSLIVMLKETSLAFVCSVVEITAHAKILAGNNYRFFESYCSVAIIYWILTLIIEHAVRHAEQKLRVPDVPLRTQKPVRESAGIRREYDSY